MDRDRAWTGRALERFRHGTHVDRYRRVLAHWRERAQQLVLSLLAFDNSLNAQRPTCAAREGNLLIPVGLRLIEQVSDVDFQLGRGYGWGQRASQRRDTARSELPVRPIAGPAAWSGPSCQFRFHLEHGFVHTAAGQQLKAR